jgi:hypothetical protein
MDTGLTAVLLAFVQAAAVPQVADGPAMLTPPPPTIVMPRIVEECPRASGSEIVVCGRRDADARYRIPPSDGSASGEAAAPRNPLSLRISEKVGGVIEPFQSERPDGLVGRGVAVRVRVAF